MKIILKITLDNDVHEMPLGGGSRWAPSCQKFVLLLKVLDWVHVAANARGFHLIKKLIKVAHELI